MHRYSNADRGHTDDGLEAAQSMWERAMGWYAVRMSIYCAKIGGHLTDLPHAGTPSVDFGYLAAIAANLRAEGFKWIIVNGADNAAVR